MSRGWAIVRLAAGESSWRSLQEEIQRSGWASSANLSGHAVLRSSECTATRRPSLSATFGSAEFPPHTDGSHLPLPPQIVALFCDIDEEHRPTFVAAFDPILELLSDVTAASREVFRVRNGRNSFLSTIVDPKRQFVRFDVGCMLPSSRAAATLQQEVLRHTKQASATGVQWAPGMCLVIDNWRTLHWRGRPSASGARVLRRAEFYEIPF